MRKSGRALDEQRWRWLAANRGAAGVLAVLFLPVLLAALAGTSVLGQLLLLRHRVTQAADFAALAAIQCLDRDELAEGKFVLLQAEAVAVATDYVRENLASSGGPVETVKVKVECFDATGHGGVDQVTGRRHGYTTVCVVVSCQLTAVKGLVPAGLVVSGHADASAVPR